MTRNIVSLLSPGSHSRKKLTAEDAIKRAIKGDVFQKPLPQSKYITSHFRLLMGDKTMQRVKLDWFDSKKSRIQVNAPLRTNERGWGMLCIEESVFRDLSSLCLVVKHNRQSIIFPEIERNAIRSKVRIPGPEEYAIEFADLSEPMLDILPKKKGRRRFTVAVSGTVEQLQKTIPLLQERACIRLEKAFIEGKVLKTPSLSGRDIKFAFIDREMPGKLEKIDCLIDLSGNPIIEKLARKQVAGTGSIKTIIIPDAARFLGMEEKILSYYEKSNYDTTDFTEVLMQISRKHREGRK